MLATGQIVILPPIGDLSSHLCFAALNYKKDHPFSGGHNFIVLNVSINKKPVFFSKVVTYWKPLQTLRTTLPSKYNLISRLSMLGFHLVPQVIPQQLRNYPLQKGGSDD